MQKNGQFLFGTNMGNFILHIVKMELKTIYGSWHDFFRKNVVPGIYLPDDQAIVPKGSVDS